MGNIDIQTGLPTLPKNFFWRVAKIPEKGSYGFFESPMYLEGSATHELLLVERYRIRAYWAFIPLPWKVAREKSVSVTDIFRQESFPTEKRVNTKNGSKMQTTKKAARKAADKKIEEWGRGVVTTRSYLYTFSTDLFAVDNTVDEESIRRTADELYAKWQKEREEKRVQQQEAAEQKRLDDIERNRLAQLEGDYPPKTLIDW